MKPIRKIGIAKSVAETLAAIDDSIDEVIVIHARLDGNGDREWNYHHSQLRSRFEVIGAMRWVANDLLDAE